MFFVKINFILYIRQKERASCYNHGSFQTKKVRHETAHGILLSLIWKVSSDMWFVIFTLSSDPHRIDSPYHLKETKTHISSLLLL